MGAPSSRRVERSLASKLILLIIVFLAVPVALYQTFKESEEDRQALLIEATQERGRLVGLGLRPLLQQTDPSPLLTISDELQRFGNPTTRLKVLFRPVAQRDIKGFFFVAASPVVSSDALQREQEELLQQGILDNVSDACTGNVTHARRYRDPEGHDEVLTSITPVLTPAGCWMIVLSHPLESLLGTSIAEPVWMRFEVRVAAAIYVAMAVLTLWVFLSVRRGVLRFRALARDLRTGDAGDRSFGSQNELVELSGVAEEFDHLIQTLRASADGIRNAAEDNAHAMKTPIAIMRQSLEPLKRIVPAAEGRGRRAIAVLENSIDRLDQLVSTARRMDEAMAELLDPPRQRVDLSRLLKRMMVAYGTVIDSRGLKLGTELEDNVIVRASEDLLETVVENIVDNSISVSPKGGRISVSLHRNRRWADLTIVDEGPGVPPEDLERIFERRFSNRPPEPDAAAGAAEADAVHAGIGLWIVRRNIEAIGGQVEAENGASGGLVMKIQVPLTA
ncbi:MAG TPA: HAMP domain-containing sensor histidine kinase [Candidatus Angelobacter sp.]|nr:HAMP domain-containing sensor histidine kinase [Candidatus Angelobacter sp.]